MSASSDYLQALTRLSEVKGEAQAQAAHENAGLYGGAIANIGQMVAAYPEQQAKLKEIANRAALTDLEKQREQRLAATEQRQQTAQQAASQALGKLKKTPDNLWDVSDAMQQLGATGLDPQHVESFTSGLMKMNDMTLAERKRQEESNADRAHGFLSLYKDDEPITPESMSFNAEALKGINGLNDGDAQAIHDIAASVPPGTDLRPLLKSIEQKKKDYHPTFEHAPEGSMIFEKGTGKVVNQGAAKPKADYSIGNQRFSGETNQPIATGQAAPITPYQQKELDLSADRLKLSQQRENREGTQQAAANAPPMVIKPNTPEYRIAQDLASGKMTFSQFRTLAAYNRNAALKFGIYDTARQLNPEFDPAQYELGFKMASNPAIRQRIVAINALDPVIDQITALSGQTGNTDLPAFNKLLNAAKFQLGNQTVANFRQMQILLGDEVGNALGLGSGSDLKTKLGLDLVNPNLSPANFKATMDQLRSILDARKAALYKNMGVYAGGVQGNEQPPATTTTPPQGAVTGKVGPYTYTQRP